MGYTWKRGSHFEKWVTLVEWFSLVEVGLTSTSVSHLYEWVTLGTTNGSLWENGSHWENKVTLERVGHICISWSHSGKWVTLGKMDHT